MISTSLRRWLPILASALVLLAPSVAAVPRTAVPPAQDEAPAPASPFASPREVMQHFVRVFDYHGPADERELEAAARTLYLEVPDDERVARARQLLLDRFVPILDRVAVVDPQDFPEAAAVGGRSRYESLLARRGEGGGAEFMLGFERLSGGGWLISRDTIASLDRAWDELKSLPVLADFDSKAPLTMAQYVRRAVPDRFEGGGIWLEPYQWAGLLLLILAGAIIERLLTLLLRPLIRKLSQTERLAIDITPLQNFERPVGTVFLALVILIGLPALDLQQNAYHALDIAASLILMVACVWATYRLVDVVTWTLEVRAARTENRFDDMLVPLLRRTLKVVVLAVGIVFVASRLTDQLWSVLAGLSIGSLAVGFAAKDSIENLFGTFTVLLDNPFKLGDVVKVSDIEGTVEQVGFRSTRIRTFEDSLVTLPNSRFIGQHVENFGARRKRRVKTALSLVYDTPPEKIEAFCEALRELMRQHPYVNKDSFHVWFGSYAAASLDVDVVCFFDVVEYATFVRERHRLFLDVLRVAQRLKIGFAFPTQTIWMGKPEDLEHPDAPRTSAEAIARGRSEARAVTETSLAHLHGARPDLVRFDSEDPDGVGR